MSGSVLWKCLRYWLCVGDIQDVQLCRINTIQLHYDIPFSHSTVSVRMILLSLLVSFSPVSWDHWGSHIVSHSIIHSPANVSRISHTLVTSSYGSSDWYSMLVGYSLLPVMVSIGRMGGFPGYIIDADILHWNFMSASYAGQALMIL